jgi:hypothetical protein
LGYDADRETPLWGNRLVSVTGTNLSAQFVYNGDSQRMKSVVNGETILLIGEHFEQKGSEITKYYFAGASRIAMRKYTIPQSMTVEYFLGDHLGSTSITTDNTGAKASEIRYEPCPYRVLREGEVRYSWTANQYTTCPPSMTAILSAINENPLTFLPVCRKFPTARADWARRMKRQARVCGFA